MIQEISFEDMNEKLRNINCLTEAKISRWRAFNNKSFFIRGTRYYIFVADASDQFYKTDISWFKKKKNTRSMFDSSMIKGIEIFESKDISSKAKEELLFYPELLQI